MANRAYRKGNVSRTNDAAAVFSKSMKLNQAFGAVNKNKQSKDTSESDAMLHHYSDEETEKP